MGWHSSFTDSTGMLVCWYARMKLGWVEVQYSRSSAMITFRCDGTCKQLTPSSVWVADVFLWPPPTSVLNIYNKFDNKFDNKMLYNLFYLIHSLISVFYIYQGPIAMKQMRIEETWSILKAFFYGTSDCGCSDHRAWLIAFACAFTMTPQEPANKSHLVNLTLPRQPPLKYSLE